MIQQTIHITVNKFYQPGVIFNNVHNITHSINESNIQYQPFNKVYFHKTRITNFV